MKHILFISHELTRTGAPMVLLNLLQRTKTQNKYCFDVLSLNEGDLESDFKEIADSVFVINRNRKNVISKIFKKMLGIFIKDEYKIFCFFRIRNRYSSIYANSIVTAEVASYLKERFKVPVILHVHELEFNIDSIVGHDKFAKNINRFDHFIAASAAAINNLVENYNIAPEKTDLVYPFSSSTNSLEKNKYDICKEIKIPEDSFIVGGSGVVEWRKGTDIFILLAKYFFETYKKNDCYFVWVGRVPENEKKQITQDVENLELNNRVLFTGEKTNPINYFNAFDVLTLVSRSDCFPLVCMESAALGKPIICFDKAGGMREFVEDDAGFVVPYLDIKAMAEKIYLLYQNPELKKQLGANAKNKVLTRFPKENSITQIQKIIESFLYDKALSTALDS